MDFKKLYHEERELKRQIKEWQAEKAKIDTKLRGFKKELEAIESGRLKYMQDNGVVQEVVDLGDFKVVYSLQQRNDSLDCPDIDAVPMEFIKKTLDKVAIKKHLAECGGTNWATLGPGEPFVACRVKESD